MAKKPSSDTSGPKGKKLRRPPFPLKVNHKKVFELARELDQEKTVEFQGTLQEDGTLVLHGKPNLLPGRVKVTLQSIPGSQPYESSKTTEARDPVAVLGAELRLLLDKNEEQPAPVTLPNASAIAEDVRAALVKELPALLREAMREALPTPPGSASPSQQLRNWIETRLRTMAHELGATASEEFLSDNGILANRLLLQAAASGFLYDVKPHECFPIIADEIREFIFELADRRLAPDVHFPPTTTETVLETVVSSGSQRVRPPSSKITVADLSKPTTVLAYSHPRQIHGFRSIYRQVCHDNSDIDQYYNLMTFAGRSDEEIASITGKTSSDFGRKKSRFTNTIETQLDRVLDHG